MNRHDRQRAAEKRMARAEAERLVDLLAVNLTDLHGVLGEIHSLLTAVDTGEAEAAAARVRAANREYNT